MALIDKLTNIADAIRGKTGSTDPLTLDAMAEAITGIEAGGTSGGNVDELRGIIMRTGTTFTDDTITRLGKYACANCSSLVSVKLPAVETAVDYVFASCASLETVYFPKITSIGTAAFQNCSKLKSAHMPLLSRVQLQDFANCSALALLDFHALTTISAAGFQNATLLATLILRNNSVCTLANVNAFNGTPFASGGTGGTVYVPSALIESYKTATNWSVLFNAGTCNFVAIEGSEYE